jgi:hypothetical protein
MKLRKLKHLRIEKNGRGDETQSVRIRIERRISTNKVILGYTRMTFTSCYSIRGMWR